MDSSNGRNICVAFDSYYDSILKRKQVSTANCSHVYKADFTAKVLDNQGLKW